MNKDPKVQDLVCISDAIANLCETEESIKINKQLIAELQTLLSQFIKIFYK